MALGIFRIGDFGVRALQTRVFHVAERVVLVLSC